MASKRVLAFGAANRIYRKAVVDFQRNWWVDHLAQHGGNVSAAARTAGENRTNIYKHLQALGVVLPNKKDGNWGDLTD